MKYEYELITIVFSLSILSYFNVSKRFFLYLMKSVSIYLPPSKKDIEDFLQIKKNNKDQVS